MALAFLIQWLVFIPAYLQQTEKFFDLTGSVTYITVTVAAVLLAPEIDGRALLLLALVAIWAVRLGTFLFRRIRRDGKDGRFDALKPSFWRFLMSGTIQGLWVTFTAAAALVAITSTTRRELDLFALLGTLLGGGFAIEVVADAQKNRFRADPANRGQFIQSGSVGPLAPPQLLWRDRALDWRGRDRAAGAARRQWIALISPLFVTLLLTRVSGIPLLEKRADEKWGGQAAYEAYKKRTPSLIPRL